MNYEFEQTTLPYDIKDQEKNILEVVRLDQKVFERPNQYATAMMSTDYAGNFGMKEIGSASSEIVLAIALNNKNEINAIREIYQGSINSSIVHPREVFQFALLNNAARIMLFHNHPSGNLEPSDADLTITKTLREAGHMMGIELLDHIIVTHNDFYSLRAEGHF